MSLYSIQVLVCILHDVTCVHTCMHACMHTILLQIIDVYSVKACEVKASASGVAPGVVGIVLIVL